MKINIYLPVQEWINCRNTRAYFIKLLCPGVSIVVKSGTELQVLKCDLSPE